MDAKRYDQIQKGYSALCVEIDLLIHIKKQIVTCQMIDNIIQDLFDRGYLENDKLSILLDLLSERMQEPKSKYWGELGFWGDEIYDVYDCVKKRYTQLAAGIAAKPLVNPFMRFKRP